MSSNLQNSIWPNEGGTLGEIKTQIPDGVTIKWPDGDALVGNFVYKDGKLAGFVDTKALILNDSATTTFPYDYVDISLPSIQEGTLTINRGERCKYLNVKFYNHEWLPVGFAELEYLVSSGTQRIDTGVLPANDVGIRVMCGNTYVHDGYPAGMSDSTLDAREDFCVGRHFPSLGGYATRWGNNMIWFDVPRGAVLGTFVGELNWLNSRMMKSEGGGVTGTRKNLPDFTYTTALTIHLFGRNGVSNAYSWQEKIYNGQMSRGTDIIHDFVPVLRDADGVAGMWDKVSKQFFTNIGTGTFGYRIKSTGQTVAPMSLRDPYYVAPSGVYARKVGENELEILADTEEVTGDSWKHFANTAEAYDHFDIIPEEIEYQN